MGAELAQYRVVSLWQRFGVAFFLTLCASLGLSLPLVGSAVPTVILDMESIRHHPGEVTIDGKKVPLGTVELIEGRAGKAVRFSFADGAGPGFMTAPINGTKEWDKAAGLSFYVKGDGSTNWGGLELIDKSDYSLRYAFCFPLDSTEWRKVVVPWRELIPELAGPLVDADRGYAPSGFGNLWFGKWFYWREYPAHSFAIDQVVLEDKLDLPPVTQAEGLRRVRARLAARQPVTLVTMGDSLSDKRHWANRETLWCELLAKRLEQTGRSRVTLINPAIGGTTLNQNLVLMPCWLRDTPHPDLVTVWFGFNDWDSGVRGPRFAQYLRSAIERIRRLTGGSADILLLTTCPAYARWDSMSEMEQAVRDIAKEANVGLADIAAMFRKTGSPDEALKQNYWAWDKIHLGAAGHEAVATSVMSELHP